MSRFALICSLVFGISSASLVTTADAQFAKAPPAASTVAVNAGAAAAGVVAPEYRIAPRRALSRADVRDALAKARVTHLAAFRAYQAKGTFPSNTFKGRKLNVWLDEAGNLCAAATIIKMSGQDDLVAKVAEQDNFIRLGDVKQGPLMDWMLTSGFTQDEIAAIQEPFMRAMRAVPRDSQEPVLVDAKLRKAEDARLLKVYKTVDKQIVKNQNKSLDKATDRLMKNPDLAWRLIRSQA